MKPWEETWRANAIKDTTDNVDITTGNHERIFHSINDADESDAAWARLQLAAAAPEMARLLLAMHERHSHGRLSEWCPAPGCGVGAGGHEPDCALVAVLRKAGVLP